MQRGEKSLSKDEIVIESNWCWKDEWDVDKNRAVDNEGWEYCVVPSAEGWSATERVYHLIKRRRWIRTRFIVAPKENKEEVGEEKERVNKQNILLN